MFNRYHYTKPLLAALILAACTPVSAKEEPIIERGRVTAVTVYPEQALVTREITLDGVTGEIELVIDDLPDAVRPGSLEISGGNAVQVHDVHHRLFHREPDDNALTEALGALEDERASNAARLKALSEQSQHLDGLTSFTSQASGTDLNRGTLDVDALERITLFSFAQRERIAERADALQREARRLDARIADVRLQLDKLSARRDEPVHQALARLTGKAGGESTLKLKYVVDRVGWRPAYAVRGTTGVDSISIEYGAQIRQDSGEDWRDVELTLSSIVPGNSAGAQPLEPLAVTLKKGAPGALATHEARIRQLHELNVALRPGTAGAMDEQSLLPGFEFALENRRNLYHRPQTQRLTLATHQFDATVYHVAQPLIDATVYRAADFVNSRSVMLLAGRASVYFDDRYVGTTELPAIAPGERFRVGLGADTLVRAQRALVKRDERQRASSRIIDLTYRFAVRNSHTSSDRPSPRRSSTAGS